MPCPARPAAVRPSIVAASEEQGFDQWLEQFLGHQREAVIANLQRLISKHVEMHHAELIDQVEKQLAKPSSQDLRVTTERLPKGSTEDETTPRLDTKMQQKTKVQSKFAQVEDTHAVSDITRLNCDVLDISELQEQNSIQDKSMPPNDRIPLAPLGATYQEADNSKAPSEDTNFDAANHLPSSKPCLNRAIRKTASFLDEMPETSPVQTSPLPHEEKCAALTRKPSYKSHRLAAVAKQDSQVPEGADFFVRIVHKTWFEFAAVLLILLNCMTVMLEAQYVGYKVGHNLGFPKYDTSANETYPHFSSTLNVTEIIFTIIFLIELVLRLGAYKLTCWKHPMLAFDMLLILTSCADVVAAGLFAGVNPAAVRCIRILKLFKMIKIVRGFSWMNSLFLIVKSISASFNALLWSLTLLTLLQTAVGLGLLQVLHIYLEDTSADLQSRILVFEYFGTFGRTFVTMFEISVGNWVPVCRILMEAVSEWFGLFFILYSCTLCFAVVNVIRAVFIAETGRIAALDDEIAMMRKDQQKRILAEKLRDVFNELDESGDGVVNRLEFDQLMTDPVMQKYLSSLDVDVDDVKQLFQVLDDGDGNISCDEFCKGVVMVKGNARAVDMIKVAKCVDRIESKLALKPNN